MTEYTVKLLLQINQDGRDWVVRCPMTDVTTQARTKRRALECLREAVELWFESCIGRGVLDEALQEAGFVKCDSNQTPPDANDCVRLRTIPNRSQDRDSSTADTIQFRVSKGHGEDFLEGSIPALIAGDDLGSFSSASV